MIGARKCGHIKRRKTSNILFSQPIFLNKEKKGKQETFILPNTNFRRRRRAQ